MRIDDVRVRRRTADQAWCRRATARVVLAVCMAAMAAACGKKGSPLPPFVRIPAAVDQITAARMGSDVYVTLAIPAMNVDTSLPVDISHVDVYGYTGLTAPPRAQWVEFATLIESIPVAAPLAGEPLAGPDTPALTPDGKARAGASVTIRDRLTGDEFVQGPLLEFETRRTSDANLAQPEPPPGALRRFYLAIAFSRRERPGPPGAQAELPLIALPEPPGQPAATYTATGVSLTWEPTGGLLGFLLDKPLGAEPLPFPVPEVTAAPAGPVVIDPGLPPGPTQYIVYRELAPDPLELPITGEPPPWSATTPTAVNAAPLSATTLTDDVEFGRRRCYVVRALRGTPPAQALSDPSPRTCLTPADVFPPRAPTGLATVPSEGGISVIWEPNADLDLGGYLVLRREAGDATLRQLNDVPVAEARFRDTTVMPGMRYLYSVVAVDTRLPLPNMSAESERVEETAR